MSGTGTRGSGSTCGAGATGQQYDGRALHVGDVVASVRYPVTLATLVRYAGASGDFNPIHWNERSAKAAGLPSVIAHGMFTMSQAGRAVTDWIGDPGAVTEFAVRFSKPVTVPDDDHGAFLDVSVTVAEVLADNLVRVTIEARSGDAEVLGNAFALVRLS